MDKEIYGVIYLIRNEINNKVYIGQTTKKGGFDRRYNNDIAKYTHNEHLRSSIEKYGIENFYIDKEFDVAYSQEELDELEDMYIKIYEATNPNKGYNKKLGGSHGKHTEEVKQKISKANKGKLVGEKNHNYGKTFSEETRNKISKSRKGKYIGVNSPIAKKVICITTQKTFDTITEGAKFYGIANSVHISNNCKGKIKSCGKLEDDTKLVWRYYDDYLNMSEIEIRQVIEEANNANKGKNSHWYGVSRMKNSNPNAKKVICITTGVVFNTVLEGAEFYDCNRRHIGSCCTGKRKSCGKLSDGTKLVWMYYDDYINQQKEVA